MSINITSQPNVFEFGYSPFYFQLTSTNSTKLDFQFIADVYYGYSAPITYIERFPFPVRPDGFGLFEAGRILENYLINEFTPASSAMTATIYSNPKYLIQFGEQYDSSTVVSAATGVTIYSGLSATTTFEIINAVHQLDDFVGLSARTFDVTTSPTPKFLTNWDLTQPYKIRLGEYMTFGMYKHFASSYTVEVYDSGTTLVSTNNISNGWNSNASKYNIGVGTANLNYGTILNSADTYIVYSSLSTSARSASYSFDIISDCPKYDLIRIAWLNQWGSYDFWSFNLKHRTFITRKNNEWNRHLGYGFAKGDILRKNLNIEVKKKLQVNTDLLETHEAEYISYLFSSPEIYLVNSDGTFIPLNYIPDEKEIKTSSNDRILQYTIDFEYGYDVQSQRS